MSGPLFVIMASLGNIALEHTSNCFPLSFAVAKIPVLVVLKVVSLLPSYKIKKKIASPDVFPLSTSIKLMLLFLSGFDHGAT